MKHTVKKICEKSDIKKCENFVLINTCGTVHKSQKHMDGLDIWRIKVFL